jgi:hypothetical protein
MQEKICIIEKKQNSTYTLKYAKICNLKFRIWLLSYLKQMYSFVLT